MRHLLTLSRTANRCLMRSLPWHPSQGTSTRREAAEEFDFPPDDLLFDTRVILELERADCCPGRAAFRIVFPAAAGPAGGRRELLLCAHHFRAGRAGLERTTADVFDGRGRLVAGFPTDAAR
jgi:hypothetical protein